VRFVKKVITFVALLSLTSIGWAGTSREATENRLDHAGRILHEIMAAPDSGIPEEVLDHAKCVAVVPNLLKGGFVFGAENGRGVATCRTAKGWSAPAFFVITGGSWGLQIGVCPRALRLSGTICRASAASPRLRRIYAMSPWRPSTAAIGSLPFPSTILIQAYDYPQVQVRLELEQEDLSLL
jgi:hypothetical protein